MGRLELIDVPAGTHTAEICRIGELFRCQINDKLAGLLNNIIRISLRADGNRYHCRRTAYGPGPCHCDNIRLFLRALAAHHHRRKRIEHIAGLPILSCHIVLLYHRHAVDRSHKGWHELLLPGYDARQERAVLHNLLPKRLLNELSRPLAIAEQLR